ncbi:bendless protein, putative [Trichomonas vaginalis G3]|uniref:Bendless protein, putative n=1 Tax=Trichomonas vaginalis (strain ATCC PRA-98 / G3) TaxID=412133 RepID=A2DJZ7_TRIV3|nr:protein modification by small protein conjugation [Trichomonas vaginalis G3]EAY19361.1 bendless protein, putative [Trichomonas vaginalis G3]KAI5527269.1 protein modification by small protein conjugation [Trichomonas vaginalis G3]|eukprot:XP_001580347.1 bendless protein [Trichomonas vaginalis G3]
MREIKLLELNKNPDIYATTKDGNNRYLDAWVRGPPGSPYEHGVFKLEIFLPDKYPFDPPKCRFLTKVYHPNIDKLGRICLDVLKKNWSPAQTLITILLSIQSLLGDPNPSDPLDLEVANQWLMDTEKAKQIAKEWTEKYAHN